MIFITKEHIGRTAIIEKIQWPRFIPGPVIRIEGKILAVSESENRVKVQFHNGSKWIDETDIVDLIAETK
jgi:hypothetical protein